MEEIIGFFFNICIFIKKKVERKRHILTSFVVFFSLKRGDFERGRAVVNSSSPFRSFSSKNSIAKDKKKKKLRNIRFFLLTYFHLAFDELCFFYEE